MCRQGLPCFEVVHPVFPLLILQDALKEGFVEAVVAHDMPKSCEFPSLDTCQERFLWTHKKVISAPHTVVGLVLLVGDAEKFSRALGLKSPDPFLRISKQSQQAELASRVHFSQPYTRVEEILVPFALACKADGAASSDPV